MIPDEVTPAWLTAVLRQSGLIKIGEVTAVDSIDTGAFNSQTRRLKITYSTEVSSSAPAHLIIKRNTTEEWSKEAGAEEVKFYRMTASFPDPLPMIPHCYAAAYDEVTGDSYVLLEDLSDTHVPPITRDDQISIIRGVPRANDQELVIDALAGFHAYWWDHPLLKSNVFEVGFWSRDAQRFTEYLNRRTIAWEGLLAKEKTWFPENLIRFYQEIFGALPVFWKTYIAPRFAARKNLTLIHGDTYFCNFLCPRTPNMGAAYLLDWQSPTWDLAGYDLVNLLAAFWTREQRQGENREQNLLRRYFAGLKAHGVQDYSWESLLADYQFGLIFWILMPVQDGVDGASKDYWWPKMQCLVDAFIDWGCMDRLFSAGVRSD